jgi:hypothetical protein
MLDLILEPSSREPEDEDAFGLEIASGVLCQEPEVMSLIVDVETCPIARVLDRSCSLCKNGVIGGCNAHNSGQPSRQKANHTPWKSDKTNV